VQQVTPAAPVTAPPAPPADPAAVAGQLAAHVAVLRGRPDGTHTVRVLLHPEDLGPVQVQVTLAAGAVDLTLRTAHEHGRAALHEALPALRRDLEAAGLTCSRLEVDRDASGSWTAGGGAGQSGWSGQQGGQGLDRGVPRPRGWATGDQPDGARAAAVRPSTSTSGSTGVDLLA
jgi:flagellar hook-length control protein FliK